MQVGRAADAAELADAGELGGDGDGVGRLAAAVEVEDGGVDELVGGAVEVALAQGLDDVGDRVLAQQHRAEDGLLGRDVLRRGAVGGAAVVVARGELDDAHGAAPRSVRAARGDGPPARGPGRLRLLPQVYAGGPTSLA